MKKIFLSLCFLFFLAGCVSGKFMHPTRTERDFERDAWECRMIVQQAGTHPAALGREIALCLERKFGYTWEEDRK